MCTLCLYPVSNNHSTRSHRPKQSLRKGLGGRLARKREHQLYYSLLHPCPLYRLVIQVRLIHQCLELSIALKGHDRN